MLRDPVQRTYSHWRMGRMWLEVSACYQQGADGVRTPTAQMADMVLDEATFPAQVHAQGHVHAHVQCMCMCMCMCSVCARTV